ncbi:archaetidylserine decarboxylase [Methyloradius palustris]|uniref:Phosphatidylserine decarboxylase proenzyme n=1 Tax=Methyloradius palustris TaxID=2778876 RepID=A0A8D5JX40_9PROT|nr:archaetidylserine decarboxylase [Methyloradius palustris]BCM25754.1 phosphatidylserine decarboxylase proenzyme [Methyloradius palustris]
MPRLAVLTQYLLPKQAINVLAGKVAGAHAGKITTAIIRWFVGRYQVNMQEAAEPNIAAYSSFNEFFTRALRADARPIAKADFICPVDGAISQFGDIELNQIFQAKGHYYSTEALLAGNQPLADYFIDGKFATLYLSPKDYHRIHMPCAGRLKKMSYVPGSLFSVNPVTAEGVPGLFARNERVICEFESQHGKFALILVGATIVGSMETVWHGVVNPPRSRDIRTWEYADRAINLQQGEEMGRFLLGSTVVLLYPKDVLAFNTDWRAGKTVKLGEAMANSL